MKSDVRLGAFALVCGLLLVGQTHGMPQEPDGDDDAPPTDEDGVAQPLHASFIGFNTNFRLSVKSGAVPIPQVMPGATLLGASVTLDEVRCAFHRPGRVIDELVTLLGDPRPLELLASGGAAGHLALREFLPDADITEIWLTMSRAVLRFQMQGEIRELPVRFSTGDMAGVRILLIEPLAVRVGTPTLAELDFNVANSIRTVPGADPVIEPDIQLRGGPQTVERLLVRPISIPIITPTAIRANTATDVVATVNLGLASVDPSSLQLLRVSPSGATTTLGALNDSGIDGDEVSNDGVFSARTSINEPEGDVALRVIGQTVSLALVQSLTVPVQVVPAGAPIGPAADAALGTAVPDDITGVHLLPRRLLVAVRPGTPFSDFASILDTLGGTIIGNIPELRFWQVEIPGDGTADGLWETAVILASRSDRIEVVAPELGGNIDGATSNDPLMPAQTIMNDLSIRAAWPFSVGISGMDIGIVDTGVDRHHNDLSARVRTGRDWVAAGFGVADDTAGHGTSVAGLPGAITNNGTWIAGITWAGRILAEKGFTGATPVGGTGSTVSLAVVEAVRRGAKVINVSFGTDSPAGATITAHSILSKAWRHLKHRILRAARGHGFPTSWRQLVNAIIRQHSIGFREMCKFAQNQNRLVVASAGNEHRSNPTYPAEWADLAVAATDPTFVSLGGSSPVTWTLWTASNFQPTVDVAATGSSVLTTRLSSRSTLTAVLTSFDLNYGSTISVTGANLEQSSGTSYSAPITSGVAALFWAAAGGPSVSRGVVRNALISGSADGGVVPLRVRGPTATPMQFRQIDAAETMNPLWTQTGLWRNQPSIGSVTVLGAVASLVNRPWVSGPPTLPNPASAPSAGTSAWWFGSPCHGTYLGPTVPPGGGRNSVAPMQGVLATPCVTMIQSTRPVLQFKTAWEIEAMDPDRYDIMEVRQADCVTGAVYVLATLNPSSAPALTQRLPTNSVASTTVPTTGAAGWALNAAPQWATWRIDLTGTPAFMQGHPFLIEFDFDTRDVGCNAYMGWVIDEVRFLDFGTVPPVLPIQPTGMAVGPAGRTSPGGC